ncbi:MAG TPA: SIMPL domain-containing protein [Opitutus sp.]|nr:SIMPL domain-containing protein [Opitutus sp.]
MFRLFVLVCVCLCGTGPALAQDAFDRPYWLDRSVIEARGSASVLASADNAAFSVTFQEVANDARSALFAASDRARLATAAMRARGGDAVYVRPEAEVTAIHAEYRNRGGERLSSERADQVESYAASVRLAVQVTDMARVADIRAAAMAVGPEETSDVEYNLLGNTQERLRVYRAAVQDASARARAAAEASGAALGRLLVLQDGQGPCLGRWQTGVSRPQRQDFEAVSPVTTVGAEQIEVAVGSRALRLSAEDIARVQLPSDPPPIELTANVCAVYAVG